MLPEFKSWFLKGEIDIKGYIISDYGDKVVVEDGQNSKVELIIGNTYKVEPKNSKKLKRIDRVGVLVGFIREDKQPICAQIKFNDTNKIGRVNVEDLVPIWDSLPF